MITQDLGIATAYGYAKSKGYTGTEAEFAELMASYASTAQTAIEAADRAVEANTAAQSAKTDASASKTAAQTAAQTATTKASEASQSASTATTKASEASQSASTASAAATSASTSAQTATTAASTANTKASEAAVSANTATTAKTDAETARDAAAQSASEAAASAESIDPDEFDRKIYAAFATDTASGAIAHFTDGADSIPMKDMLVHVEPVQDLHGQESPYPAGGGKNKFDVADESIVNIGVTFTASNNTLTCIGIAESGYPNKIFNLTEEIPAGTHTVSFVQNDGGKTTATIRVRYKDGTSYGIGSAQSAELTHESPITGFQLATSGGNEYATTISNIQIEEGSTATAYAPYSNICPISGWTGAKVTRTGKNLWTFDDSYSVSGYTVVLDRVPFSLYPGTYTFSAVPNMEADSVALFGYHEDGTRTEIGRLEASTTRSSSTATVSKPVVSLYFVANRSGTISNIQLELGSTATKYEPYSGQTYDITFPSEAGTVYGGTLDVTKGELVVDRAIIASYAGEILPSTWISDRDVYSEGATPTTGAQVCYKLATPITYQLTPQEITSLLGENNVWADTGNTKVEYRASTKMYIDKKITEAVSALS